ncbi:MAG: leucine-rich repeat domain-containing protein, partial [Lachnospiraceae bacterium]|nr:leucine-rich repeat domain-containing protein [Lachnospiraceae bacterium]
MKRVIKSTIALIIMACMIVQSAPVYGEETESCEPEEILSDIVTDNPWQEAEIHEEETEISEEDVEIPEVDVVVATQADEEISPVETVAAQEAFAEEPAEHDGEPDERLNDPEYLYYQQENAAYRLKYHVTQDQTICIDGYEGDEEDTTGELVLPDTIYGMYVTKIGYEAFSGSRFTGPLNLPTGLKEIGAHAFNGCSGLYGDLILPDSVEKLGNDAFHNCYGSGGNLLLSNNLQYIGEYAFDHCGFSGSLIIPDSVREIGKSAFLSCGNFDGDLVINGGVIGTYAFKQTSFKGHLIFGEHVTEIGEGAFAECSFTGSLIISNSVKTIKKDAFQFCSGFTGNLVIGNSVESIDQGAFDHCLGFNGKLTIGERAADIHDYAFGYGMHYRPDFHMCTNLSNRTITILAIAGSSNDWYDLDTGEKITEISCGTAYRPSHFEPSDADVFTHDYVSAVTYTG